MSKPLIIWSNVREHILERAKALRPGHKFTRVSVTSCRPYLEAAMQQLIDRNVESLPSVGETIKF